MAAQKITRYYNQAFWLLFIAIGILVISGSILAVPLLDLALGLLLIALGLHKIYEEVRHKSQEEERKTLLKYLDKINTWLSSSHAHNKKLAAKADYRVHNLDRKQSNLERKIDKSYRELARKIIELENELNRISKAQRKAYKLK